VERPFPLSGTPRKMEPPTAYLDLLQRILDEGGQPKGVTALPDWLPPWLEPGFAVAVGTLLGGLGLFITRVSTAVVIALPAVRDTVDWWDDRQDRRAGQRRNPRQPRTTNPTAQPSTPARQAESTPAPKPLAPGRHDESTQLALPLEDGTSTSSPPVRRVS
jgi:hypothetical protein